MEMRWIVVVLCGLALAGCQGDQKGAAKEDDPSDLMFAAVEAIRLPVLTSNTDRELYQKEYERAWKERRTLVLQIFEKYPDDKRTAKLMDQYWQSLMTVGITDEECDKVVADIKKARESSTNATLRQHAAFWGAFYSSYRDREDVDAVLVHADTFSRNFENDPRGATLYSFASMAEGATHEQMERAFSALVSKYPSTQEGEFARVMLPMLDNVGKPFEFEFEDPVTGERHRDKQYRGKVLVVDWWATWCVPCVQAMPKMKAVYEQYKAKGVEFIGVSLDRDEETMGGLTSLREFVEEHEIPWPQYYLDGKSAFADRYMVSNIPTVFIVGRDGRIVTVDGYRTLERTLEKLTS